MMQGLKAADIATSRILAGAVKGGECQEHVHQQLIRCCKGRDMMLPHLALSLPGKEMFPRVGGVMMHQG
jgi:hypothetical protein